MKKLRVHAVLKIDLYMDVSEQDIVIAGMKAEAYFHSVYDELIDVCDSKKDDGVLVIPSTPIFIKRPAK